MSGARHVALVVALRGGLVLVARRAASAHLGGLWEFPGGKLAAGELPADAARRELAEETALVATTLEPLGLFFHDYAERTVHLHVFVAREPAGDVRTDGERVHAWMRPVELDGLEMPEANGPILRALERWIG